MQPLGFSRQAERLVTLCNGGFPIWAAKPSVRESPNPAEPTAKKSCQHHLWAGWLLLLRSRFTESSTFPITC